MTYKTAANIRSDWVNNTASSEASAAFIFGVDNPRYNPMERAIIQIENGTWEKNFKNSVPKWVSGLKKWSRADLVAAMKASAELYETQTSGIGADHWESWWTSVKPKVEAGVDAFLAVPTPGKEEFKNLWNVYRAASDEYKKSKK